MFEPWVVLALTVAVFGGAVWLVRRANQVRKDRPDTRETLRRGTTSTSR